MKNLRLGVKIGLGFGVVILVIVALGGAAFLAMRHASENARRMKEEHTPAMRVTAGLERVYSGVRIDMRGYGYSGEQAALDRAKKNMLEVLSRLEQAKKLAVQHPGLTKLGEQTDKASALLNDYLASMDRTEALGKSTAEVRSRFDAAVKGTRAALDEYYDAHREKQDREISSGETPQRMLDRAEKLDAVKQLTVLLVEVSTQAAKAQSDRNPKGFDAAEELAAKAGPLTEGMRVKTTQEVDRNRLALFDKGFADLAAASLALKGVVVEQAAQNRLRADVGGKSLETILAATDASLAELDALAGQSHDALSANALAVAVGLGVALVLAVLAGIVLTRAVTGPVIKGVGFAKALAGGDFTQKLDVDQKDEIGQLAAAMNDMVDKLREIVAEVQSASDNVASGSTELSSSAQSLSQGASEQAASVEEVSSSMEEMSANIKQNADNALQTLDISQHCCPAKLPSLTD